MSEPRAEPARQALLLVNLGTPDAARPREVRSYLREFLSDPHVLDLHPLLRWLLLELFILPRRPARSARAYQSIWTERGSPLLVHGRDLTQAVSEELRGKMRVELAMRYGSPSLAGALSRLRQEGVEELTVFPLYPQLAYSTTVSTIELVEALVRREWPSLQLRFVPPFYDSELFLQAFAEVARPRLEQAHPEQVLFSFHGMPIRHLRRVGKGSLRCLSSEQCCQELSLENQHCYRAQSFHTARELAARLELAPDRYSVAFQSRFGSRWIGPLTEERIRQLAAEGVKSLAVLCPSFVADCLETLEEIGFRGRESFLAAGGRELFLVPSLNSHPAWVKAVAALARGLGAPVCRRSPQEGRLATEDQK